MACSPFTPCLVSLQYTLLYVRLYSPEFVLSCFQSSVHHPDPDPDFMFTHLLHVQRIHFSHSQLSHNHPSTSHHPLTIIWFSLFHHHSAFNKHCVHLNLSVSSCVCDNMGICCLAPALTGWDYENGFPAERERDFYLMQSLDCYSASEACPKSISEGLDSIKLSTNWTISEMPSQPWHPWGWLIFINGFGYISTLNGM